jgi:hypothetical protein
MYDLRDEFENTDTVPAVVDARTFTLTAPLFAAKRTFMVRPPSSAAAAIDGNCSLV